MTFEMCDGFSYPHGDVQTWVEGTGEEIVNTPPPEISAIVAKGQGTAHAFYWRRSLQEQVQLQALMINGMMPVDENLEAELPRLRVRDRGSGMIFKPTNPLTFASDSIRAEENELLRAGALRLLLKKNISHAAIEAQLIRTRECDPSVMAAPIADYEASTLAECRAIVAEIEHLLIKKAQAKLLWFRGQTCEFPYYRALEVKDWLRLDVESADVPSLVPSLGRFAIESPGRVDLGYAFLGPSHWWKKPFLIWIIRQNPMWLDHYPDFVRRLNTCLASNDDALFQQILGNIQFDPRVPDEIDDLRQWFFAHYKYGAWIWVLQQYGYLSSMLDVTWDLDTALFFTQAARIDGRFTLPDPADGRVIYVFAEAHDSKSYWDANSIDWGDLEWARQHPPRVAGQRAGCLTGSTWFRQNYYGYLVLARIRITGRQCLTSRTIEEIFPSPDNDLLLRSLMDANPRPEGLYW